MAAKWTRPRWLCHCRESLRNWRAFNHKIWRSLAKAINCEDRNRSTILISERKTHQVIEKLANGLETCLLLRTLGANGVIHSHAQLSVASPIISHALTQTTPCTDSVRFKLIYMMHLVEKNLCRHKPIYNLYSPSSASCQQWRVSRSEKTSQ